MLLWKYYKTLYAKIYKKVRNKCHNLIYWFHLSLWLFTNFLFGPILRSRDWQIPFTTDTMKICHQNVTDFSKKRYLAICPNFLKFQNDSIRSVITWDKLWIVFWPDTKDSLWNVKVDLITYLHEVLASQIFHNQCTFYLKLSSKIRILI